MDTTLRQDYFFEMSMVGEDKTLITEIVNQGIDSRLEGFTKSEFKISNGRLFCWIHPDELQILIRRLNEYESENADSLADDIVSIEYGYETV